MTTNHEPSTGIDVGEANETAPRSRTPYTGTCSGGKCTICVFFRPSIRGFNGLPVV